MDGLVGWWWINRRTDKLDDWMSGWVNEQVMNERVDEGSADGSVNNVRVD